MSKPSTNADNLKGEPLTYRVERMPNLTARRIHLAQSAAELSAEDLKAQAEAAQVDLAGSTSKASMVEAVQAQVRGSEA
jgi:hypothetical protein